MSADKFKGSGTAISVRGLTRVKRLVRDLERAGHNTGPVFKAIGTRMRNLQLKHFDEQKQFDKTPWPPLSEATLAARRSEGVAGVKLLRDHDIMYTSITFRAGRKFAVVGTNDPKGPFHQGGKGRPPRREFIFLRDDDVDPFLDMLVAETLKKPTSRI